MADPMTQQRNVAIVLEHVKDVIQDPTIPLDTALLESLTEETIKCLDIGNGRMLLLNSLSKLLPTLRQDPTPATSLVMRLVNVPTFSFQNILEIDPSVDFGAGLTSESIPINMVTVELLAKAKYNSDDGGTLATMNRVVHLLVQQLLLTDVETLHLRIQDLLVGLLTAPHSNLSIWRRVLDDRDIYETFFWCCSLEDHADKYRSIGKQQPSQRRKTITQGRLLAMLAQIDSPQLRQSHCSQIERTYNCKSLLHFAVDRMVDYKRDVIMHLGLMQFFVQWLRESTSHGSRFRETIPDSSPALHYLQSIGLHARTAAYYHSPTGEATFDSQVLYSQAAHYLETYYLLYPKHAITKLHHLLHRSLARVSIVLGNTSPGDFTLRPPVDLKLLVAMPRAALMLKQQHRPDNTPVYLQLPCASNAAAVFRTLASLFDGRHATEPGQSGPAYLRVTHRNNPAAARALYFLYNNKYPCFWEHVIQAAENLALKEAAIEANHLIFSVIDAQWDTIDDSTFPGSGDEPEYYIHSEQELADICGGRPLPPSPPLAILSSPALENVIPYLLKPAQVLTGRGIGGNEEMEKTVNEVAATRFNALSVLHWKLKQEAMKMSAEGAWWDIVAQMERRLHQGRWGGISGVGGTIATMER